MKRREWLAAVLLCLLSAASAWAVQSANARLSGTVSDATGALIPGVAVTVTNRDTGVVTTALSNETGTYNFPSLQPGVYEATAELAGFQTAAYTGVDLGISQQLRLNFTLEVATVAQAVEVVAAVDAALATTSASVGAVLPEETVIELPEVGRNALRLVNVFAGVQEPDSEIGRGRTSATFAGIYTREGAVNTTRDGVSVQSGRYALGVNSSTNINPDLIGEMRVIVAPVDAETGGGVGQVQIRTRSGTNEYRGSAVWNVQNSALDAATWNDNRVGAEPTWFNRHQLTLSLGGPIVRNRTFFFFLFDGQRMNSREQVATTVLTAEARQGLFRFFPGVVNGNADSPVTGGSNPQAPVVDLNGNPVQPAAATGPLQTVSVFDYDPLRTGFDSTGFVQRLLADMPLPNDFRGGDGLNTALFRWNRPGDTLIGAQFGTEDDTNREQYNTKIDHNFNERHKLTGSFVLEYTDQTSWPSPWPNGWNASATKSPRVLTTSFTSTLSPAVLNEFRFGFRRENSDTLRACDRADIQDEVFAYLPEVDGYPVLPALVGLSDHRIAGSSCNSVESNSPTLTLADSLSWIRGTHSFKGGWESRLNETRARSRVAWIPEIGGGAGNFPVTGITGATIPGLIGSNLTEMEDLLLGLSGSVNDINQSFRLAAPTDAQYSDSADFAFDGPPFYTFRQYETSAFFKDDWNVTPSLTLNLGVRWDYHHVPYEKNGLTAALIGGGMAAFGWSGRSWEDYWRYGPQKGDLSAVQFIGPNSPNPDVQLWEDDWNNFGPAVGFSWSLPWFGQDRTTMRGGYSVSYLGTLGMGADIDAAAGYRMPGTSDQIELVPDTYTNLANIHLPLTPNQPLKPIPLTQRSDSITVFDPNWRSAYVQSFNLALTRSVTDSLTVEVRYIGTKGTKLYGQVPINQPNFLTNGLLEAFSAARAGGESALLDAMFTGLDVPGVGLVDGAGTTGADVLRQSNTFRNDLARGAFTDLAETLNRSTLAGEAGDLLRNAGLPENFIVNNPQFNNVTMRSNLGSSIYHSMQLQATLRPTGGATLQTSYTWSKAISSCGNPGCSSWTNPLDRKLDRGLQDSHREHAFRLIGTYELPFGPGQLLGGGTSGIAARLLEGWQLGWIFTANSGGPLDISTNLNTYVGEARPTFAGAFPKDHGQARMTDDLPVYFDPGAYQLVDDPQCARVTSVQGLRARCNMLAVADASGNILIQHAEPGTLGNVGSGWILGPGTFSFDLSASKTVNIDEIRSVQLRVDAENVLNTPIFGSPNLNINSPNFGRITSVSGSRRFQAQLRVQF